MAGIHFSFSNTLTFPYPSLHGNQKQSKPEAEHPDRIMPSDSHYLDRLLTEEGGAVWSRTWKEEVGVHVPSPQSLAVVQGDDFCCTLSKLKALPGHLQISSSPCDGVNTFASFPAARTSS